MVTTALGIPKQIAFQSLTAQETAITNRLDITKLQDPKFVKALTNQYLLAMQQNKLASTGNNPDPMSVALHTGGLVV